MTPYYEGRAQLAAANADAAEHTAVRVRLRDDIDLLEAEARDLQAKLFEAGCQLVAAGQQIAERDAILAERAEALRTALEWGAGRDDDRAKIAELRSDLELSIARTGELVGRIGESNDPELASFAHLVDTLRSSALSALGPFELENAAWCASVLGAES